MLGLYADECVRGQIIASLRRRGLDVLTAVEDGREGAEDSAVLDRAAELGRILYTEDGDFLIESANRQQTGQYFGAIVYAHPLAVSIGTAIEHVEIILTIAEPQELDGQVLHLPLKGLKRG